jgi:hypothetical protein
MSRRRRPSFVFVAAFVPLVGLLLSGCGDVSVKKASALPHGFMRLPPVGFSHVYGNSPLASQDGLNYERGLFGLETYWEIEIVAQPARAGFVSLGNRQAVARARHAMRSLSLVVATEIPPTITGVLAFGSDAGQEVYSEELLDYLHKLGYNDLQSASVRIYFTEFSMHSRLTWTGKSGYKFHVFSDNGPPGTTYSRVPGQKPLPNPVSLLAHGAPPE